jgi:hypothetical protein
VAVGEARKSRIAGVKVEPAIDENGAPMLLVAGAAREVPTRSGNPAHQIASGQFGGRRGKKDDKQPQSQPQPDPGQGSDQRRRDAVVDAARTLEDLSPAGVERFVRGKWAGRRAITQADIDAFAADARTQRVHDVVDALDYRIRKAMTGRAGSRQPHVVIPRGLQRKSLAGLEREDLIKIFTRLRDRGWSDQQIKRHGVRRLDTGDKRLQGLLS